MNVAQWSDAMGSALDVLWRASWQGAVLAGLVLAVMWVMGTRVPARWRFNLWLIVLVRLALPVTPSSSWSLFNLIPERAGAAKAQATDAGVQATANGTGWFAVVVEPSVELFEASDAGQERLAIAPTLTEPPRRFAWQYIVAATWLVGVLVLSARVAWASIGLQLAVRRMCAVDDWAVLDVLDAAAREIGVKRELRVLVAPNISTPALMGVMRPKLLLPPAVLSGFDPQELRLIFLHELAHLRRNDVLVNWLMTLLLVVHWFNPMVWLAISRLRLERELACDERVLSLSGRELAQERRTYGLTILKLLESLSETRVAPPAGMVGILEAGHPLKRRIAMIAHFEGRSGGRWWAMGAVVSMIAIGCVALTDSEKHSAAPSSAGPQPANVPEAAASPNELKIEEVQTTVKVPDGGTLLLGGTTPAARGTPAKPSQIQKSDYKTLATTRPREAAGYSDPFGGKSRTVQGIPVEKDSPEVRELEHQIRQVEAQFKASELKVQKHLGANPAEVAEANIEKANQEALRAQIGAVKARMEAVRRDQIEQNKPAKIAWASPRVSSVPKDDRVDQTMARLRKPVPEVNFNSIPLSDTLDFVRDATDMNLVADYRALEAAGIDKATPVTLRVKDLTAEDLLEHIGRQVGGDTVKLGIMVEGNVVTFTTGEQASRKTIIRAYDVSDLVAGATTRPGADGQRAALEELTELVQDTVEPDSWQHHGGSAGSISTFGNTLVVRTTPPTQMDVEKLLGELRGARGGRAGGGSGEGYGRAMSLHARDGRLEFNLVDPNQVIVSGGTLKLTGNHEAVTSPNEFRGTITTRPAAAATVPAQAAPATAPAR